MPAKRFHVIYAKHNDRLLHKAIRVEAMAHDLTISQYVVAIVRYFMELPPATQDRALRGMRKGVKR